MWKHPGTLLGTLGLVSQNGVLGRDQLDFTQPASIPTERHVLPLGSAPWDHQEAVMGTRSLAALRACGAGPSRNRQQGAQGEQLKPKPAARGQSGLW